MIKRTSAPEAGESDAVSQEKKTEPVKDTLPVPEKPASDATEAPVVEAAPKAQTAPTVECTHTLLSSLPAAFTYCEQFVQRLGFVLFGKLSLAHSLIYGFCSSARDLPGGRAFNSRNPAFFRFHLTMDTLALN